MKHASKRIPPEPNLKYVRLLIPGVLSLILLFGAVVRLRMLGVSLERDEGEYAYAGQLMLRGFPPYLYAYNMKFPGIYAAYAGLLAVFGQSPTGIRLGLLLLNAGTTLLIFFLGKRLISVFAGLVAAGSYALLSLGEPVLGTFAHATHFVVFFAVAGAVAFLRASNKGPAHWLLISGVLFGLSVLMKQHGVFFPVFAIAYVLWQDYRAYLTPTFGGKHPTHQRTRSDATSALAATDPAIERALLPRPKGADWRLSPIGILAAILLYRTRSRPMW